jgi:ABC-type multidrug transport system ATPase subunit
MESNKVYIKVENLTKKFDSTIILDSTYLSINRGEVFYLLGPNGSGKSTLINCLLGLLQPEEGTIRLFGNTDLLSSKSRIGIIPEDEGFIRDISVEKNLKIASLVKNTSFSDIPYLLEKLSLTEHKKKLVKKLSNGLRKRLAIAISLLGDPDLLIWDEPYNSLDPSGIIFLNGLIKELNSQGKTILIASHLLSEAEKTGTSTALIHKGKIEDRVYINTVLAKYGSLEAYYKHHIINENRQR